MLRFCKAAATSVRCLLASKAQDVAHPDVLQGGLRLAPLGLTWPLPRLYRRCGEPHESEISHSQSTFLVFDQHRVEHGSTVFSSVTERHRFHHSPDLQLGVAFGTSAFIMRTLGRASWSFTSRQLPDVLAVPCSLQTPCMQRLRHGRNNQLAHANNTPRNVSRAATTQLSREGQSQQPFQAQTGQQPIDRVQALFDLLREIGAAAAESGPLGLTRWGVRELTLPFAFVNVFAELPGLSC